MSSQPNIREATLMHCVRCAKAATTQRDQDYWKSLAVETWERYHNNGGNRIRLYKSADGAKLSFKVDDPSWLTPEEQRELRRVPLDEVLAAERELREAAHDYALMRSRQLRDK